MNSTGRMGVTMICSSVPISRSRTTAKAVSVMTSTTVRLPMIPGTKNQRLLQVGVVPGPRRQLDRRHHLHQLRSDAADAVLLVLPAQSPARSAKCSRRRSARCSSWSRPRSPATARSGPCAVAAQSRRRISRPTVAFPCSIRSPSWRESVSCALHVKVGARCEARNQFAALLAVIEIEHHRGHMMNLKGGRIAEDQHLNQRRTNQNEARPLVAEDLDELLDQ